MKVDLDDCIERLWRLEWLAEELVKELCDKLKELLVNESNVINVEAPVTVVGDLHGQYYDVLDMFRVGGMCPNTNYVFLGDYVDRGHHSVETISLLMCLKLRYPNRVSLIRGNHESRSVNQIYGFFLECQNKYGNTSAWTYFTDLFDYLPMVVLISDQIFCVHGGLSPALPTVDSIRAADRFQELPPESPLGDLMWSDPDPDKEEFALSARGAGYTFGSHVVERFLETNRFVHILRSHQLCKEGYQVYFDDKLSTVWSAPNYMYMCGNKATIVEVADDMTRTFNQIDESPMSTKAGPTYAVLDYFL